MKPRQENKICNLLGITEIWSGIYYAVIMFLFQNVQGVVENRLANALKLNLILIVFLQMQTMFCKSLYSCVYLINY